MRIAGFWKLAGLAAVMAAAPLAPAAAQNNWTGASSFHDTCFNPGTGTFFNCPKTGNNSWNNNANWSLNVPNGGQDVNIGLSTQQFWNGTPQDRPTRHDSVVISTSGQAGNLHIGFSGGRALSGSHGRGILTNNGTLNVTTNMVVGSTGRGDFANAGGTTIGGSFVVGAGGQGVATNSGAISVGGNTSLGQNAGVTGTMTLTGTGSLTTTGSLTVGESGVGDLAIGTGTMVDTTGRVTLGENVTGGGRVVNQGTMTNRDRLVVGEMGYGYLETTGAGATTTVTGSAAIGAAATGTGIAIVSQGTMNNGGRLDVGLRGEGYLIVDQGGEANNAVATMAKEAGSTAYALVAGTDSLWDNRTSLTLASENGSAGVLVINDGGAVRIDDGNGTLTIAEHAGSTGILNIGAMTPEGDDYGIHADVSGYLGSIDTDPNARAPGTLDAALVRFGDGAGVVNFKHTSAEALDYRFAAGFAGEGTVNHFEGFTVLDGDSSAFTGPANVIGGTMVVNNVLAGDVTVSSGATLRIGHESGGEGTTGHVVNDIVSDGIVRFDRSDAYVYDSVISATGDLEQIGSGTTVLTGENTYTGATSIVDGTLQIGDGGTTGSIDHTSGVFIDTAGRLAFDRSDVVVFDRLLTGDGTLRQIGTGLTRLTEDNSAFTGRTFVDAGTLSVAGILGGSVRVNAGATLEGLGTVGNTVVHGSGAIAPGNATDPNEQPIGALTADGALRQEADSAYQAEVRSTGENDFVHVTRAARLDPGALLHLTKIDAARYELEHRYTVLTADGGLTGTYTFTDDSDTWVSTFYRVEDNYDANNVYLDVAQFRLFQEAGDSGNQINAATAAQELKTQRDPVTNYPTNELFRAIAYLQTDAQARSAFDHISGELHASTQAGLLEDSRFVRNATGDRLRAVSIDDNGLGLWATGFGAWGHIESDGNAARLDQRIGGLLAGVDAPFLDTFRVGVMAGYSNAKYDVDGRRSTAESDTVHLGLYGGAEWNGFAIRLGGNYNWHRISASRSVVFTGFADSLTADYDARSAQIYGDIGYAVDLGTVRLEPFAGLAYVNVDSDAYEEEEGGAAALAGSAETLDTGYGMLGLRGEASAGFGDMLLTAGGSVEWRRAFARHTPAASHSFAGSSDFVVYGVPVARDVAVVELGLDAAFAGNIGLGVSYTGLFGDGIRDQGVEGNVSWRF